MPLPKLTVDVSVVGNLRKPMRYCCVQVLCIQGFFFSRWNNLLLPFSAFTVPEACKEVVSKISMAAGQAPFYSTLEPRYRLRTGSRSRTVLLICVYTGYDPFVLIGNQLQEHGTFGETARSLIFNIVQLSQKAETSRSKMLFNVEKKA